jgi:hypothetical protein
MTNPDNAKPNVVYLDKLTPEYIANLRQQRLISEQEEQLELDPIQPGEQAIGTLTDEERVLYVEIAILDDQISETAKELYARSFEKAAAATRAAKSPADMVASMKDDVVFKDNNEAEQFFYEQQRYDYLKSILYWSMRNRLKVWGAVLGIRAGYTVVIAGHKYKVQER